MSSVPEVLRVHDVAVALRVSRRTVYRLVEVGALPPARLLGKIPVWLASELAEALARLPVAPQIDSLAILRAKRAALHGEQLRARARLRPAEPPRVAPLAPPLPSRPQAKRRVQPQRLPPPTPLLPVAAESDTARRRRERLFEELDRRAELLGGEGTFARARRGASSRDLETPPKEAPSGGGQTGTPSA